MIMSTKHDELPAGSLSQLNHHIPLLIIIYLYLYYTITVCSMLEYSGVEEERKRFKWANYFQ